MRATPRPIPTADDRPRSARWTDAFQVAVFLALIVLPGLGSLLGVNATIAAENRHLAPAPELALAGDAMAAFPGAFDAWYRDHFGFRSLLIRTQKEVEWVYDRTRAGIAIGREGWLYLGKEAELPELHCVDLDEAALAPWLALAQERGRWFGRRDTPFLWVLAPNKASIYPEFLPDGPRRRLAPGCPGTRLAERVAAATGTELLDLRVPLRERAAAVRLYHRTDSHWNERGGLEAARAILERLGRRFPGIEPIATEAFEVRWLDVPEGGNLSSQLSIFGLRFPEQSARLVWRAAPRARPVNGTPAVDPNWAGHPRGRLELATGDPRLPRALVFHDSFGYALIPLLAERFESSVFVHTAGALDLGLVEELDPDVVIAVFVEAKLRDAPPEDRFPPSAIRAARATSRN